MLRATLHYQTSTIALLTTLVLFSTPATLARTDAELGEQAVRAEEETTSTSSTPTSAPVAVVKQSDGSYLYTAPGGSTRYRITPGEKQWLVQKLKTDRTDLVADGGAVTVPLDDKTRAEVAKAMQGNADWPGQLSAFEEARKVSQMSPEEFKKYNQGSTPTPTAPQTTKTNTKALTLERNIKPLEDINLENPLTGRFGATSLVEFFTKSIPSALMFFLGLVVMVVFLLSALRYLFSAGGDDKKGAIQGMTYAAFGAAVVVLGYAIIALVQRLVT